MDCKQCDAVLAELEHIDDEAESGGVDFVKIDDKEFARQMGVFALPAVVFFRHGKLDPVIYAGDLKNEERILDWLLVQKDPNTDVIEEFEDHDQLIEFIRKMEFVAVYFCNQCPFFFFFFGQKSNLYRCLLLCPDNKQDCNNCQNILDELENIDDDTDRNGIHFLKTQARNDRI